ncbi:hypothetical protein RYA05_05145 [Pseudomonas syringae pv. actinidiae]|nr:hypothetical protein [Pseudomonas syringae pv. actinidiae]
MDNVIYVGEIQTGYNSYSQRTDDFADTLMRKLNHIMNLAEEHQANVVLLGGIRERISDINSLPIMISNFFRGSVFLDHGSRKSGYKDILLASKCVQSIEEINLPIFDNIDKIPPYLINHTGKPQWLVYTGDIEDTLVLDQLMIEAIDEGKALGIIAPSKEQRQESPMFKPVHKVFRDNQSKDSLPTVLLVKDGIPEFLPLEHDANTFKFENVTADEIEFSQSEFVKRLHAESLNSNDSQDKMSSQVKLESMIGETLKRRQVSPVSSEIIRDLFNQTLKA